MISMVGKVIQQIRPIFKAYSCRYALFFSDIKDVREGGEKFNPDQKRQRLTVDVFDSNNCVHVPVRATILMLLAK